MVQLSGGIQNPADGFDSLCATPTPEVEVFGIAHDRNG